MMLPPPPPPPGKQSSGGIDLPLNIDEQLLESLERGAEPEAVWNDLIARGCSKQQADNLVQRAMQQRTNRYASIGVDIDDPESLRAVGNRNRQIGMIFVVAGIMITFASFAMAGATGFYLVTTGLIGVGVTLFIRGQYQVSNAAAIPGRSVRRNAASGGGGSRPSTGVRNPRRNKRRGISGSHNDDKISD
jgi:hypothetical protein